MQGELDVERNKYNLIKDQIAEQLINSARVVRDCFSSDTGKTRRRDGGLIITNSLGPKGAVSTPKNPTPFALQLKAGTLPDYDKIPNGVEKGARSHRAAVAESLKSMEQLLFRDCNKRTSQKILTEFGINSFNAKRVSFENEVD